MEKRPFLSICIPTYNRLDILNNTLHSIYEDLKDINIDDFEVVISDNEPNQSSKSIVNKFSYNNIHYFPAQCEGFLNSFNALKCGKGAFLKLHNNYTMLNQGTLLKMITSIKNDIAQKPLLFFTNGLAGFGKENRFNSFDEFMTSLSYFSSWSAGFGIWKENFNKVKDSIEVNHYFPQTSLMLTQSESTLFIINDKTLFIDQSIPKKGGYNIFKVFSVDYIQLIKEAYSQKLIKHRTFLKIKNELLYDYIAVRYFKTVILRLDNFEKTNIKESITVNYSSTAYYYMLVAAIFSPVKILTRKIKSRISSLSN
jgi:glycosyltransferase involved in cell wall biosynthesis